MEWWQRVKLIRELRHPRSGAFAREIGITPQRMSDIEAGRHKNPSLKTLRKLANGFGMTISEVVGETRTSANIFDTRTAEPKNGVARSTDCESPLQVGVPRYDPLVAAFYDRIRSDVAVVAKRLIEIVAQHGSPEGPADPPDKGESDRSG